MILRVTNFACNQLIWRIISYAKAVGSGRKSRFSLYLHPVGSKRSGLSLPLWAEERRSAGLRDPAHAAVAVAAWTGLAFVAVYRPVMLEITERTIGLDVIAQR